MQTTKGDYPLPMLDALFGGGAAWFTVPALLGTGIFLIKLFFMSLGGGDDLDIGGDASAATADIDGGHSAHGHNAGLASLVSVPGISAFVMGFGWGGLGALKGLQWSVLASMGIGLVAGVAMSGLFIALVVSTRKLAASGNINFAEAKGGEAEVYATIPAQGQGRGQVRLIIAGRQRIVQAISNTGAIATSSRVRVVEVKSDNSVVVEPIA
jgi:hypothetical protein